MVDLRANKRQIQHAMNKLYNVKCAKVNTVITPLGFKKAYVRLTGDSEAMDVANKIALSASLLKEISFYLMCDKENQFLDQVSIEEESVSQSTFSLSKNFEKSIRIICSLSPEFSQIMLLPQPWNWQTVMVYFLLVLKALQEKREIFQDTTISYAVVDCYFDSLDLCDDINMDEFYKLFYQLIAYLPIDPTFLYRMLFYFCYHDKLCCNEESFITLIHSLANRLYLSELSSIYEKLEEDKDIKQQKGTETVLSILSSYLQQHVEEVINNEDSYCKDIVSRFQYCNDQIKKDYDQLSLLYQLGDYLSIFPSISISNETLLLNVLKQLLSSSNTNVVLLSLSCIKQMVNLSSSSSYFKSDNDLQLLLTNLHSSPSIEVRKEVCSVLSIILEKFHRLKDLKRFIKAILPSLQPDRIAKLSLINHEEGCYCEILWLLSQKENLLKVQGTLRNSMIAALLPLYTSSNKEIYCYFKELLCIIAPTKEILLPLLNKQKNDVIKHVIESYPCEFTKNDLPDHYFPTASPRIASSPYKQTTTKFSFDFVDKSNSPPIVKDTKASKQISLRNARERRISHDFKELCSIQYVSKYCSHLAPEEYQPILFPSSETSIISSQTYRFFEERWQMNKSLSESALLYNLDLFMLYFSYRLLQRKLSDGERMNILQCISSLCSWCSSQEPHVLFTGNEVMIILFGLFYRNHLSCTNPSIQLIYENSNKTEFVACMMEILSIHIHQHQLLTTEYHEMNTSIILGIIDFLATQIENDSFFDGSKTKYPQHLLDIVQYDDEEVKKKGEELIHTFCRIVYSTQLKRTNDIRVSVFNLCLQNSRSRRKEKKIGLPQDVLEDMKKNSFTQNGYSSSIPSSSSSSSSPMTSFVSTSYNNSLIEDNMYYYPSRRTFVSKEVTESTQHYYTRYDNGNIFMIENSNDFQNSRKSHVPYNSNSDDSSDDGIFVQKSHNDHSISSDDENSILSETSQTKQKLSKITHILDVTVTLYQSVPYITILKEKYSSLYNQLVESLDQLTDILSFTNNDVEDSYDYNNDIIFALFKLLKLCLEQYIEIPILSAQSEDNIIICKDNIKIYREDYIQTHDPIYINKSQEEMKIMFSCSRLRERCNREITALTDFLRLLLNPVETISSSSHVNDICSWFAPITIHNILSALFYTLDYPEMKDYSQWLYDFFVVVIKNSDALGVYTCLFDFIKMFGTKESVWKWSDLSIQYANNLLSCIHDINMNKSIKYSGVHITRIQTQINDLVNKNIDDTLQDTILSINQDLSIVSDTMRECYFNHPSRLTEFTRSDY